MTAPGVQRRIRYRMLMVLGGVVAGIVLLLMLARSMVPSELALLAGETGSGTHRHALLYKSLLEKRGLRVRVVTTAGAVETLDRMEAEGGARAGFAQVVLTRSLGEDTHLATLGGLYVEPLWVFTRPGMDLEKLAAGARGPLRLATGRQGSEIKWISESFIQALGYEGRVENELFAKLTTPEACAAVAAGKLDVAFAIGEPSAPNIRKALEVDGVTPLSFRRARAYANLAEGISRVTIPEGALDLPRNVPPHDLQLVGVVTSLVVPEGLHPAVAELLLDTARRIHSAPTLFSPRGAFPSPDNVWLPLHPMAEKFYEEGPNVLGKYLPFWLATLLERSWLLLAAILGALVVLLQLLPVLVSLPFMLIVQQLYLRLEKIEKATASGADLDIRLKELDELDRKSVRLWVPPPQRASYFEFRQNIHDMRERLEAGRILGAAKS